MLNDNVALEAPLTHDESATLLGQTMGFVALTAGFFALGAYLGRDMSYQLGWLWFIASLACLIGMNFVVARSEGLAVGLLIAFGVLIGLAVAPTISHYASTDPRAVWQAGGATALFVAAFGAAGYGTRRDLSALARWFFWALVALLVFGVVLIFVDIPNGALIYAVAGLVIFAGLTAFDFQRLRQTKDIRTAPLLAASIFLDALNVFLFFLAIFDRE
jgi:FtsH-binding integral membrane protein